MTEQSTWQSSQAGVGGALPTGSQGEIAARARFEREAACLDLTDAEQAAGHSPAGRDLAVHLYQSADRHRLLAERLEVGDTSALLDAEPLRPPLTSTA